MKKQYILIILVVMATVFSVKANARPNVDYNRLVTGPATVGPAYINGVTGNATLQSTVNVKLRIVRFNLQNLGGAFNVGIDEVNTKLFTKINASDLAPLSYRSDPDYATEGFFQDQQPKYTGWPTVTHLAWMNGNEETFNAPLNGEMFFESLVTPLSQAQAINWEMGYTYDSSVSFSGNFISSLIDIAGVEYIIKVPEIVAVDSSIADIDGDGVLDLQDNCVSIYNPNQDNSDFDGFVTGFEPANYGDPCDGDLDNNEVVNFNDLAIWFGLQGTPGPLGDYDQNGIVNLNDVAIWFGMNGKPVGPTGL